MMKQDLMLSVCCTTYNHSAFIEQTVESFLMQQTNFQFDIVIGDDCSTDGASEILKSYEKKYPGKIKVVSSGKNVGAHQNMINTAAGCGGKYIALCDGDDYWTDPFKLQKQVDFLEANPDFVICCHYTRVINKDGDTIYVDPEPVPLVHTFKGLLTGNQVETKTATVVYRNLPETSQLFSTEIYFHCFAGDKFLKLFATYNTGGKIYVMPAVMSCYRNHVGGVWSMINADVRREKMISDFNLIIRYFRYGAAEKRKLLLLYAKRYFLFELKRFRLRNVYNTVKLLL